MSLETHQIPAARMSNGTYLWPGDKMREFFRAHIRRETSLDTAAAEKLAEALTQRVNRMLVWEAKSATEATTQAPVAVPSSKTKELPKDSAFDPFAFSVMVVLTKTGRDGLTKRLADIKATEHLKALIDAQHLAVDRSLKKPDELRKAIIVAAEQRLADRKAAAS